MNERERPQAPRPWWVALTLWGLPNRTSVLACFWLSLAIAIGCLAYGLVDSRFYAGGLFFVAAWL